MRKVDQSSKVVELSKRIKRVYFVGAGFSAGLGYPVGNSLLPRLIDWLEHRGRASRFEHRRSKFGPSESREQKKIRIELADELVKFLVEYLHPFNLLARGKPETREAAREWLSEIPVTSFFSICQTLSENQAVFSTRSTKPLYDSITAAIRTYFLDICWITSSGRPSFLAQTFTRPNFDADNSIVVNFNWDEELDAFFSGSIGLDYTLGAWTPDSKPSALMLKPHGSVGWYEEQTDKTFKRVYNGQSYFIADGDKRLPKNERRIKAFYRVELPKRDSGKFYSPYEFPPVIAPPTFAKRFSFAEQHLIWTDVISTCSQAEEFVFLGYTLPADDYLTRAALGKALSRKGKQSRLRCLIVGKDIDRSFDNFQQAFGGTLDRGRNFRNWTFGFRGSPKTFYPTPIGQNIEDQLKIAKLVF